jgi:tetratricopeptide (TPR) repeat protein
VEDLQAIEKAIELRPSVAILFHNRGMTYAKLGNKFEAIADFKKSLKLDPNYKLAKEELAKIEKNLQF